MQKNNIYNFLEKKEVLLLKWIGKNQFRVILFIAFAGAPLILSRLPYFNLVFRGTLPLILVIPLALLIFRIDVRRTVYTGLFFFILSMIALMLNFPLPASSLFDFGFAVMIIAFIKFASLV